MAKLLQALGRDAPYVTVLPPPVIAQRAPATSDTDYPIGQGWVDQSVSPNILYYHIGSGVWQSNELTLSTDDTFAGALDTTASSSLAIKTYVDASVVAGGVVATTATSGIGKLVSDANAVARIASTGAQAYFVQPSNLTAVFSAPGPIGDTTPDTVACTDLTADGTLDLDTTVAGHIKVTGAADFTVQSTAGSIVINGEEAADDAIQLTSAAGGLAASVALSCVIASTETNADSVQLTSAGGMDITATGAAGKDLDLVCTSGSVNVTAGEAIANSIVLSSTNGGIDILAPGASAGLDIDITNTGGSVNISSSENVADAVTIDASAGGIQITNTGTAGEDIVIASTGASVTVSATENAASAIYLHADGGVSETVKIHSDQGTGVASIDILSDVGGITLTSGLASADAVNIAAASGGLDVDCALSININSSQAAATAIVLDATTALGGIDVNAGTGGMTIDSAGVLSLDSAGATNLTATGAFDVTVKSTAGSVIINAEEAVADAIQLQTAAGGVDVDAALQINVTSTQAAATAIVLDATTALGGIDVNAGTGGMTIDSGGVLSLDSAGATNLTATGAFDVTVSSTAGSIIINGEEAADDAIQLTSAAGGLAASVALSCVIASTETNADSVQLTSAGGMDITATGAAAKDIDIVNTNGSININSGEAIANSMVLTSAGGLDMSVTGGAGLDIDMVCTNGSVNLTAGESASDALVVNCSGAASGASLTAGTAGFTLATGLIMPVTSRATAGGTYTCLGTDYFIDTDSTGGALQINLPAAPETGRTYIIYDGVGQSTGGNLVTVSGNGNNIASGGSSAASKTLATVYSSLKVTYNGTIWCGQFIT